MFLWYGSYGEVTHERRNQFTETSFYDLFPIITYDKDKGWGYMVVVECDDYKWGYEWGQLLML